MRRTFLGLAATATLLSSTAMAAETGTLKAKFVYGGAPPSPPAIDPNKDQAFCGKHPLVDESLLVNKENNGIQNVILYVYTGRGGSKLPKSDPSNDTHELANDKCRFEPHVVIAQAGDTLKVTNPDAVGHNANLNFFANNPQNFTIPPGGEKEVKLEEAEPAPIPVECNIHPWMKAYVVVLDHPYAAVSDKDGVLTIEGLPAGEELNFRIAHEAAAGSIDEVKINGKTEKWRRNRFDVKIKPGMNDLGEIEIPAEAFK
ncbi:methylamine utilization protein [Candidatus Laterigemmans baculatus]|nr:methylamine utilization protein [Candidatus Laterigemmans baculatus]